jgi:3-hydroxyacyl-[acyl-carrier-protein] dehydratase
VYYFVGIDGARFKKPVMPGDRMIIDVELTRSMRSMWKYAAKVTVDGALCAQAELMTSYRSNVVGK